MDDFLKNTADSSPAMTGDVMSAGCPSREILRHMTSRWGVLVLVALRDGTLRFSELKRRVDGVSERMLTQTLQHLEADHIIDRKAFNTVPPHVEYSLTAYGQEAAARIHHLVDWLEDILPALLEEK